MKPNLQVRVSRPIRCCLKPLATIHLGGVSHVFYVGLGALILNVVIAAVVTLVVSQVWPARKAPAWALHLGRSPR